MSNCRQKLQELLYELFQFDSADLDLGFYAVMNQKRDQIAHFIQTDLLDAVVAGLQHIATQSAAEARQEYGQARYVLEQQFPGLLQGDEIPAEALATPYIANSPVVQTYQAARAARDASVVAEDMEAQIYNDLYAFFSRYYQDGDFISQRRYGRSDKYAIPYNGQEVHLHWANFDQYYVKTGVHFNNYSFTVPSSVSLDQGANVHVRLTKVDVPRDNVKGDKRFFIHAADQPVEWDEQSQTLVIPMEYRPLTVAESDRVGTRNSQDKLLEQAHAAILEAIPNPALRARLMEPDPRKRTDKDRLAYHLNRYAAENTRDFFVHKDLGGFLRREFDYYLKAEVLHLEGINFDDPIHARRAAARLKTTRAIGEKTIAFLDQLERFQRQLFLKRKFILQSDYCLTLDKIPAGRRADFYPAILANARQLAEWRALYGVDVAPETDLSLHPHLMLDTAFFDAAFKACLLACFDDLDAATDGLLVHGENFQALNIMVNKYGSQVHYIYIDPPYNTSEWSFVYKNDYKHSSWISMMRDRLAAGKQLLVDDGVIAVAIDDTESHHLRMVLDSVFLPSNRLSTLAIEVNPAGQNIRPNVPALSHDYCHIYAKNVNKTELLLRELTPKEQKQYTEKDEKGYFLWDNLRRRGGNSRPTDRPGQWYPLYVNYSKGIVSVDPFDGAEEVWPIDPKGKERIWRYNPEGARREIEAGEISVIKKAGRIRIVKKSRMPQGKKPKTLWKESTYSATTYGTKLLGELIGAIAFSYPKSLYLVQDCLRYWASGTALILDFFAGSGTTAHAIMNLNREDDGNRKYILVEMADYFDTVLKPRIQKIAYADKWKDGRPIVAENGQAQMFSSGQSHMFHYIRLESYDDTFHNIRFRDVSGPQLSLLDQLPDYFLGYMLDHETAGSPTRLDIGQFERPFDYQLLVTGEDGVLRPQPVDLAATFNFLTGLAVHTIRHYAYQGQPYVRVTGVTPGGARVCVLWRNVLPIEQLDAERDWALAHVLHDIDYDKLYVNGENTIPNALLIEDEFKRRMMEDVH